MIKLIVNILYNFQVCFKRKETFLWFVLIVFGMLLRDNQRGVSSIIGTLGLNPDCYELIIHFFRSKAYDLKILKLNWIEIAIKNIKPAKINGRILLVGDHIKVMKEAKYMPGVKKHHQESENVSKPEYIFGHQFGMIGMLSESSTTQCIPLDIEIHDGMVEKNSFCTKDTKEKDNCIAKIIKMVEKIVKTTNSDVILILDAYFSNQTAFKTTEEINRSLKSEKISLIMRGKSNTVGFTKKDNPTKRKKGRPRKYGDKVILKKLFENNINDFSEVIIKLYSRCTNVKYLCIDLLWKPVDGLVRFVLVDIKGKQTIFMSSNLSIDPVDIVTVYSKRFKIEVSFKMLKHTLGGFFYHFWTKSMPKISKYQTQTDYSIIKDRKDQEKILKTIRAIEVYTFINCITLGILMIIAINHTEEVWVKYSGWLRTRSSYIPSPDTVKNVLQKELIWNYHKVSNYAILRKMKKYKYQDYEKIYQIPS